MESHQAALCILHIRFEWESNGNSDNGSNSSSTTTFSRMCLLAQVYVTFSPDWTMGYFVKFSANSMICGDFIKYLNGSRIGSKWKTGGKGKALATPFLHCRMFLVLCMVECLKIGTIDIANRDYTKTLQPYLTNHTHTQQYNIYFVYNHVYTITIYHICV